MEAKMERLKKLIEDRFPEPRLEPAASDEISALQNEYRGIPQDLLEFFRVIGFGQIGKGRYMVHDLLPPDDIYDPVTARSLDGVLIVGDDFAGNCEAYDTTNEWMFGSIGSSGSFEQLEEYGSLTDWLLFLFAEG